MPLTIDINHYLLLMSMYHLPSVESRCNGLLRCLLTVFVSESVEASENVRFLENRLINVRIFIQSKFFIDLCTLQFSLDFY